MVLFAQLERVTGIEPVSQPWEGRIIPLYDTRKGELCAFIIKVFDFDAIFDRVPGMDIVIVGGGASGLMAASLLSELGGNRIMLIEKNKTLGAKLLLTGGGRCNVTTGIFDIDEVLKRYPRGSKFLKFAMHSFSPKDVFDWFEDHRIYLKIEKDLRVFPRSEKGTDVLGIFEKILKKNGVKVLLNTNVKRIKNGKKFSIELSNGEIIEADKVLLSTGGNSCGLAKELGHKITPLAPGLCSIKVVESWPKKLSGVSFAKARLKISAGKNFEFVGPFLFTHEGVSGPAVFAISSLAAFEKFNKIFIDFLPDMSYEKVSSSIKNFASKNPKKLFINNISEFVPQSLARELCTLIFAATKVGFEINSKDINKITELLKNLCLNVSGSGFGEEFVTAGGVDLGSVNSKTMESKIHPGLYFTGEVLDVDGFTGGFNLQAAWATAYVAAHAISKQ